MTTLGTAVATEKQLWTIDPAHTDIEFGVRHLMISTVKGRFDEVDGEIAFDPDRPSDGKVEVRIAASSIDTGNADRDKHLRSADFFDVANHPELRFRSTKVEQGEDGLRVHGELSIRGETRSVVLEGEFLGTGTDPWGNERVGFRAGTRINRKDFGLTWNQALETGGVLVGEEVKISLDVQAVLKG
jgi:polyisoprenoid-binding protein YceI